jgi:hypothetical protein
MPWLAVDYADEGLKRKYAGACQPRDHMSDDCRRYNELLDVEGIPTLAIFGPGGELITEEGARTRCLAFPL